MAFQLVTQKSIIRGSYMVSLGVFEQHRLKFSLRTTPFSKNAHTGEKWLLSLLFKVPVITHSIKISLCKALYKHSKDAIPSPQMLQSKDTILQSDLCEHKFAERKNYTEVKATWSKTTAFRRMLRFIDTTFLLFSDSRHNIKTHLNK